MYFVATRVTCVSFTSVVALCVLCLALPSSKLSPSLQFPLVLVGNKKDLESERQVSVEEGRDLGKRQRLVRYLLSHDNKHGDISTTIAMTTKKQ